MALAMGFTSGLPLLLSSKTLQAWMTDEGVDLKTIGLFALAGLPYTFKFIWAPMMDRFVPKFLGRRRGWLLLTQFCLAISVLAISTISPKDNLWWVACCAVLIAFFSASQDVVIDAYRRESLHDEELGLGSSLYVYGYRIAMLISGAGALMLADQISWNATYMILGGLCALGIFITYWAEEPKIEVRPPQNIRETIIEPLSEFFSRNGAWLILAFILLYKVGDTMAGNMTTPFYLKLGFTKTEIAAIAKTFGLFSSLTGAFIGGLLVVKLGIHRSLWIFGFFQAASTAFFAVLSGLGPVTWGLTIVVAFEDLTGGMGTAAFVAYMASLTNKKFTATQYALLSSVMGVPRTFIAAPTGYLAEALGWSSFFIVCGLAAIPGMLLLTILPKDSTQR